MQQAQGPKPGMSEKWIVVSWSPIYDARDGIRGTRTTRHEFHFTRRWAEVRANKLNETEGGDDYVFGVMTLNARGRLEHPQQRVASVGVVEVTTSELPF